MHSARWLGRLRWRWVPVVEMLRVLLPAPRWRLVISPRSSAHPQSHVAPRQILLLGDQA
jgi:hypothetical protein